MAELLRLRRGDVVEIQFSGAAAEATVLLSSENGCSLAFSFDAMLGGYAGTMPVLWLTERQCYVDLIQQAEVTIRRKA